MGIVQLAGLGNPLTVLVILSLWNNIPYDSPQKRERYAVLTSLHGKKDTVDADLWTTSIAQ